MKLAKNMTKVELKMSKDAVTGKMGLSWLRHSMRGFGVEKIISDGYRKKSMIFPRKRGHIDMSIYEEVIIKEARRGSMVQTYNAFKEFIDYNRNQINPMAFIKYEALIDKWKEEGRSGVKLHKLGNVSQRKSKSMPFEN